MLIHVLVIVILVLLFIIAALLSTGAPVQDSTKHEAVIEVQSSITNNIIISPKGSLSIVSRDSIQLERYCTSWGYNYNNVNNSTFTCFLNEEITNVNNEQSMNLFLSLLDSNAYITFADSDSYITNNNLTIEQIREEITSIKLSPERSNKVINSGYPCLTKSGMILSKTYLTNIFQSKPLPFDMPHIMPSMIPARTDSSKSRIPKVLYQTFETSLVPSSIRDAVYSWIIRNPEYEYRYYDERARRKYIAENFNKEILQCYDKLIPGAYRADFWRYCVMYLEGGVYADIKLGPLMPLNRIIDNRTDLVLVNDHHPGAVCNGFFASTPKNKAIYQCILECMKRVNNKEYGEYPTHPTGPIAMGAALLSYYKSITNHEGVIVYDYYGEDDNIYIKNKDGERLIVFRHSSNITEANVETITGLPHYRELWKNKAIYYE